MFYLNQITHQVGSKVLYEKQSLRIGSKDKVALIGLNGVGKTTLFKIVTGEMLPESGRVERPNGYQMGYLDQNDLSKDQEKTILEVAMQAFPEQVALEKKIANLLEQMKKSYRPALVDELAALQERFLQLDGYNKKSEAEKVLEGIGFKTNQLTLPLQSFSGGWRMRVLLGKLLLQKPQLLLLDEPTNHLDIASIQWLENYLKNYPHAVFLISHDRHFLNQSTNKTVEIRQKRFYVYAGNYNFYEKARVRQQAIEQQAYLNQQKDIAEKEAFIQRFRSKASKAKQVQSVIKSLNKLERLSPVVPDQSPMRIRFKAPQRAGNEVVTIKGVTHGYGNQILFLDADATIRRGDKIALIGENGKGKTTLLQLIAGRIAPQEGRLSLGHNVHAAFYAQHQYKTLDPQKSILESVEAANASYSTQDIRQLLGAFLFEQEAANKLVGVLSGGEKARVALAKMIVQNPNLLLLDEPTNHLDMVSEDLLAQALRDYPGTLLLVSHNRTFISKVANTIWYLKEGEIKSYPGTYDAYLFAQGQRAATPGGS